MRIERRLAGILFVVFALGVAAQRLHAEQPEQRRLRAQDVFDLEQVVIFREDFSSGTLEKWNLSEDDRYRLAQEDPRRIKVVDAPALKPGTKAARFTVPRAPGMFRAEISLPHEEGYQERWYGARILVPEDWVVDTARGNDIVMQWHAIPGNWRATYPNLEISVGKGNWHVRQSYGVAQEPTRTDRELDKPVKPGTWVSWVVRAKWSPDDTGILQIWKDGELVIDDKTANVYSNIGVEYTPYLKTGIYHPEWNLNTPRKAEAFRSADSTVQERITYVADVKVGSEKASYDDVAPQAASKDEPAERPGR